MMKTITIKVEIRNQVLMEPYQGEEQQKQFPQSRDVIEHTQNTTQKVLEIITNLKTRKKI